MKRPGSPQPRLARRLLELCLPSDVVGRSILGDLEEEYEELTRGERLRFPRLWYWMQAVPLAARYALRGRGGAGSGRPSIVRAALDTAGVRLDFRIAARVLLKHPVLSGAAIITLALGVALTTFTFATVHGAVIRGLPLPDADRLLSVTAAVPEQGAAGWSVSPHDFRDLRRQQTAFEDLAGSYTGTINLSGEGGAPERFAGAFVSSNFFDVVGVFPRVGRGFDSSDADPGSSPVLVLGHHVWVNRFGSDPNVVGTTIRMNGETAEIVGVMPDGFRFPFAEDLWTPNRFDPSVERGTGTPLDVYGRYPVGGSEAAADRDLGVVAGELAARFPDSNTGMTFEAEPYANRFMPAEIRAVTWVMLAAVFGVLLVACANVANLLLALASLRSREVAIRTALGSGRARILRQFFVESSLLAVVGGGAGLLLAVWGVDVFNTLMAGVQRPYWISWRVDPTVVLFTLGLVSIASVAGGLAPAVRASGVGFAGGLRDQGRGSTGARASRFSSALVVGQVAVSCCLLIGAGFMVRSVLNLRGMDMGFDGRGVVTGRVGVFESDYPDGGSVERFFTELRDRIVAEPGVRSVALTTHLPALGAYRSLFAFEDQVYGSDVDLTDTHWSVVSDGFLETFDIPLLEGRALTEFDGAPDATPSVLVSRSFAERHAVDNRILGRRVRLGSLDSSLPWMTVVGVIGDVHVGGNVGGIGDDRVGRERIVLPMGIVEARFMSIAVRPEGPAAFEAARVRELVAELDPDLPVYDLNRLENAVRGSTWAFATFGSLFGLFGAVALLMAAVGLYGVMSFSVSTRRREFGIRAALGATTRDLLRMVLRRGLIQVGVGASLGLVLGVLLSHSMTVIFFQVDPADPLVYLVILGTLGSVGVLATVVPARVAALVDPMETMRAE